MSRTPAQIARLFVLRPDYREIISGAFIVLTASAAQRPNVRLFE
jgi:hypothetical protein